MVYQLDANHLEIVAAFKQLRCKVVDNAKVKRGIAGQLDIWVGFSNPYSYQQPGLWIYVEIKTDSGKLTTSADNGNSQTETVQDCLARGLPVEIVRSVADVEKLYYIYLALMRDGQFNTCSHCQQHIPIDTHSCGKCVPFWEKSNERHYP